MKSSKKKVVKFFSIGLIAIIVGSGCKKDMATVENPSQVNNPQKSVQEKSVQEKEITDKTVSNNKNISDIAVTVNEVKLTNSEVDSQINDRLKMMGRQVPQEQMEKIKLKMRTDVIENFVTKTLVTTEAEKQNIAVSDKEVDELIVKIEQRMPKGMTLEDVLKNKGMDREKMRKDITSNIKANKLIEGQVMSKVTPPSEKEMEEYYNNNKEEFNSPETVHARHILITVDPKDNEETKGKKKKKIEGLRKELLKKGADFAKIAKENSDCPSKEKGGDLGTFPRGAMVKPFEDAAFSQEINEISPRIETDFGYHIIQTLEHNKPGLKSFVEVKDQLSERLKQQKMKGEVESYIEGLKKNAKIDYGTSSESISVDIPKN
ncbi:MAG: peptidylprolyl isomerase [bacterium]